MSGHTDTHALYTDIHFNGSVYRTAFKGHHKRAVKKLEELKKAKKAKEIKQ